VQVNSQTANKNIKYS